MLLVSELGLLPPTDPRFVKTCEAIGRELMRKGRIMRYAAPDDFGSPETAFLACNFWYIDALHRSGATRRRARLFESILASRNAYGLLSEDIHPETGELWGNLAADLFHGGHHQYCDAIIVELGGRMGPRLVIVSNRVAVPGSRAPARGRHGGRGEGRAQESQRLWFGWSGNVDRRAAGEPRTSKSTR